MLSRLADEGGKEKGKFLETVRHFMEICAKCKTLSILCCKVLDLISTLGTGCWCHNRVRTTCHGNEWEKFTGKSQKASIEAKTFQSHHEMCYGQLGRMLQAPKTKGKRREHTSIWKTVGLFSIFLERWKYRLNCLESSAWNSPWNLAPSLPPAFPGGQRSAEVLGVTGGVSKLGSAGHFLM